MNKNKGSVDRQDEENRKAVNPEQLGLDGNDGPMEIDSTTSREASSAVIVKEKPPESDNEMGSSSKGCREVSTNSCQKPNV